MTESPRPKLYLAPFFVFAVVAPLMVAFAWQGELATFGDDSASYLTLAHYLSPAGSPLVAQWAGYHANFPPLFPLALALSGGFVDLHVAYALVAVFGALGVVVFHRYAVLQVGRRSGLVVTLVFLLTATAWISLKGVLSESLFLLMSMAALLYYEARLAPRPAAARYEWLLFGVLLACTALTRAIGIVLFVAYLVHAAIGWMGGSRRWAHVWLPAFPVIVLVGLWHALRPHAPVDAYQVATSWVAGSWLQTPGDTLVGASKLFFNGWIRSFLADHDVALLPKVVLVVLGFFALAGAVIRVRRNRLDGWFVVLSLAVVFAWVFSAETTRRLLYPLLPLLILYAAQALLALAARAKLEGRARSLAVGAAAALPMLVCLPALALIAQKSFDTRPVIAGCPHTYREISDYYWTLNGEDAAKLAVLEVTMLCGLQSIDKVTQPGARVMWTRPEYVALLGRRAGVASYHRWTPQEFAAEVRRAKVGYLVVAQLSKTDLEGASRKALPGTLEAAISTPVFALSDGIFEIRKTVPGTFPE